MASKWALAKANEIEKKHGHCCGDVIELYTDSLAEALDAAAEEYHEALIGEIREKLVEYHEALIGEIREKLVEYCVLDKLGR